MSLCLNGNMGIVHWGRAGGELILIINVTYTNCHISEVCVRFCMFQSQQCSRGHQEPVVPLLGPTSPISMLGDRFASAQYPPPTGSLYDVLPSSWERDNM